ncbi:MAG: heavy metal-associated domain-containing protein [Chitinophagales bacterium]
MKKICLSLLSVVIAVTVFAGNSLNLTVKGMHCGGCETKFKSTAASINGITEVSSVSAANSNAVVVIDEKVISAESAIKQLAEQTGYTVSLNTAAGTVSSSGAPAGCCMKGQNNSSCKAGNKAKCAKSKCNKPANP